MYNLNFNLILSFTAFLLIGCSKITPLVLKGSGSSGGPVTSGPASTVEKKDMLVDFGFFGKHFQDVLLPVSMASSDQPLYDSLIATYPTKFITHAFLASDVPLGTRFANDHFENQYKSSVPDSLIFVDLPGRDQSRVYENRYGNVAQNSLHFSHTVEPESVPTKGEENIERAGARIKACEQILGFGLDHTPEVILYFFGRKNFPNEVGSDSKNLPDYNHVNLVKTFRLFYPEIQDIDPLVNIFLTKIPDSFINLQETIDLTTDPSLKAELARQLNLRLWKIYLSSLCQSGMWEII